MGAAAAAALLALTACSISVSGNGLQGGRSESLGDADEGIDGVEAIRVADPTHTESTVDYDRRPPAGGVHAPMWWNCGFYDAALPDENAGHDLEHGVVWLAYSPDLDDADVEVVHDLARANAKVLAAPYPDLPAGEAVVATAWARQLRVDSADDERLAAFVEQYQDGAEAPEAGATCTGSDLGVPIP